MNGYRHVDVAPADSVEAMGGRGALIGWLALLVIIQVGAFELFRRVFVGTERGQRLDTAALAGNSIGQGRIGQLIITTLDAVSVISVVAAVAAIGFIALVRGRVLLAAVTTGLVVGANVTTQLLKAAMVRPELGVDLARAAAGNSFPSGHTTVTASVAVALVLVLPAAARAPAALIGAAGAGLVGVATLSAGWHRPSDAIGAFLVVGAWAAVAALVLVLVGDPTRTQPAGPGAAANGRAHPDKGHHVSAATLAVAGIALLVIAGASLTATDAALTAAGAPPPELLTSRRLFVAYAGGAAGIAAAACLTMALLVTTVHRVVPSRP